MEWKVKDNCEDWYDVRKRVFVEEQGFQNEFDETDKTAIHITMYEDGAIVGCARCIKEEHSYRIGRVALLPAYRKKGYGKSLLQYAEGVITDHGGACIYLDAQCRVIPFYEKNGYQVCGEEHLDEGVAHKEMKKVLV